MNETTVYILTRETITGSNGLSGKEIIGVFDNVETIQSIIVRILQDLTKSHDKILIQNMDENGYHITLAQNHVILLYYNPMILNLDYTQLN